MLGRVKVWNLGYLHARSAVQDVPLELGVLDHLEKRRGDGWYPYTYSVSVAVEGWNVEQCGGNLDQGRSMSSSEWGCPGHNTARRARVPAYVLACVRWCMTLLVRKDLHLPHTCHFWSRVTSR